MSVMLTATKSAVRKKSARAKGSAKPKKRTVPQPTVPSPGRISANNVKMWQWSVVSESSDGIPEESIHSLTFRKDTMEIWVNDVKAKVEDSFAEDAEGAVINFDCESQKGTISTCRNEIGELEQVLTLETPDGPVIVE